MSPSRDRLLEAAYACVARFGIAKTTMEDVSREARLSRATVYRYFPGGKDQVISEVVAWQVARFFADLAAAVDRAPDLPTKMEQALLFAHRAVEEHEVLQKILETEPELLMPVLTVESARILELIKAYLRPELAEADLVPGVSVEAAAEWMARMLLTYINAQGMWDLTNPAEVRELVRTELLAGVLDRSSL